MLSLDEQLNIIQAVKDGKEVYFRTIARPTVWTQVNKTCHNFNFLSFHYEVRKTILKSYVFQYKMSNHSENWISHSEVSLEQAEHWRKHVLINGSGIATEIKTVEFEVD